MEHLEQTIQRWRDRFAAIGETLTRPEGIAASRRTLDLLDNWLEALDDHRDDQAAYDELCRVVGVGFRALLAGISLSREYQEFVAAPVIKEAAEFLDRKDRHREGVQQSKKERFGDLEERDKKIIEEYNALIERKPEKSKATHQRTISNRYGLSVPMIKKIIFPPKDKKPG